jgi:ABC-type glycerol-3-phosphate transport system substrate-binding protein
MKKALMRTGVLYLVLITVLFSACSGKKEMVSGDAGRDHVNLAVTAFVHSPDGTFSDPVTKYVEESLNVTLDITSIDEATYPTLLSAMIAAGDLPDVFTITGGDFNTVFTMLMDSNSLLALDPYLEQYAPRTLADPYGKLMIEAYRLPATSPDGKLYIWGVCKGSFDDGTMPTCGHYLLWDVYKKAGYPKLENYDNDLLDVLEKMTAVQPTSVSGEKTYGLGAWFGNGQDWGEWVFTYGLAPQEGVGLLLNAARSLAFSTVDSRPINVNQLTDPNSYYWRAMHFYARANMRGLLDPDSFIQTSDIYEQKVKDGRYMFNVPGWMSGTANIEFAKDPSDTRTFISLPSIGSDAEDRFGNMYKGERMICVNSKTKHPERVMEFLDFISTHEFSRIMYNGLEGKLWNIRDGKPVPTDEYLSMNITDDIKQEYGLTIFHHFMGYANGTIDPANGVPVDLYQYSPQAMEKKMNNTIRDFLAYYKQNSLADVYRAETPVSDAVAMLNFGAAPEEIQNYVTGLNAYIGKNFTKVIAVSSEAEYIRERDAFIAGMAAYHVDEIFQHFYNEAASQGDTIARLSAMMP